MIILLIIYIICKCYDEKLYVRCQQIMHLRYNSQSFILQCTNHYYKQLKGRKRLQKICNFSISLFRKTWFSRSRLGIVKTCRFIAYFLIMQPPRRFLMHQLEMSSKSINNRFFCREVCINFLTLIYVRQVRVISLSFHFLYILD